MRRFFIVAAAVVGLVLGMVSPASALEPFIHNGDNVSHNVGCDDGAGHFYVVTITPGQNSPRGCIWIEVPNPARTNYLSYNTGAGYWTACGNELGFRNANGSGGFHNTGGTSSVNIVNRVWRPTPPANVC